MSPETKNKLIVPFIIFVVLFAVNTNSIVKGIDNNQVWRVVIASASDILILAVCIVIFLRVKKSSKNQTPGV